MKRFIVFFAVMALIIAMLGCAVNSTTGGITVVNKTTKDASNVKVGSVSIGFVGKGQSTTIYFSKDESNVQVTAEGFTPQSGTGKINLKLNYSYTLVLNYTTTTNYTYYISGLSLSDNSVGQESMN